MCSTPSGSVTHGWRLSASHTVRAGGGNEGSGYDQRAA
jgi:hypothetical protein